MVQGTFIQGGGKVILGTNDGLPIAGTVTFGSTGSNGTLDLAGYSQQVGDLAIGSARQRPLAKPSRAARASANLIFSGVSTTFAGTIQDYRGQQRRQPGADRRQRPAESHRQQ